jgi:hypothetical protein
MRHQPHCISFTLGQDITNAQLIENCRLALAETLSGWQNKENRLFLLTL